jgi:electron transfer flavoprotein-quinone oxidoreductase
MEDKFDVIIVGAGLAGCAAAIKLAREGLQVVLIERGTYPGSKNLSGGVLYGRVLQELIPEYWTEAPVERYVTNQIVSFMTKDASINMDFKSQAFAEPPYNGFSVLRGKFDRWLGEKAEEAGVMLVPGIRVDRLIKAGEDIVGVVAGDEEMFANVIVAADGANSFLAQEAGLRGRIETRHLAVGVKELIGLPRETIDERFNLTGDEGVAYGIVGYVTQGIPGGGFLYTNKESISIGLVVHLDEVIHTGIKPADLMDSFLAHPLVQPLVRGGKLLEYGAHLVPEGGLEMVPRLSMGGMLLVGDAAGLSVNNGLVVRGMDLAIGSGMVAAEVILEAKSKNDFSAQSLGVYQQRMENSFVLKDMKTYAQAPHFMKSPRMYAAYPEMLSSIFDSIYTQDAKPKAHIRSEAIQGFKESKISLLDLLKDGMNGARAL